MLSTITAKKWNKLHHYFSLYLLEIWINLDSDVYIYCTYRSAHLHLKFIHADIAREINNIMWVEIKSEVQLQYLFSNVWTNFNDTSMVYKSLRNCISCQDATPYFLLRNCRIPYSFRVCQCDYSKRSLGQYCNDLKRRCLHPDGFFPPDTDTCDSLQTSLVPRVT